MALSEHFAVITGLARGVLQSLRNFKAATANGKTSPLGSVLWDESNEQLEKLRQYLTEWGYFEAGGLWGLLQPEEENPPSKKSFAAFQTLVEELRNFKMPPVSIADKDVVGFTCRLTEALKALERLPTPVARSEPATIYYLGNRAYRVGEGEPVTVSDREDCILQAFIGAPVLDMPRLAERSGLKAEAVPSLVKGLREKYDKRFADAIKPPGGKGKGGYRANVSDARGPAGR